MSIPVSFSGTRAVLDRTMGQTMTVRVWGQFIGSGVDAHEVQSIQQWIEHALFGVLDQYAGPLQQLPSIAPQWGATAGGQLAQAFYQQFQAQGQIHIQGIDVIPDGGASAGGGMGAGFGQKGGDQFQKGGGYDQGYAQKGGDQYQKGYDQGGYGKGAHDPNQKTGYDTNQYQSPEYGKGGGDQYQKGYDQGQYQQGYDPNQKGGYDPKGGYGGYDGGKDPYKKG